MKYLYISTFLFLVSLPLSYAEEEQTTEPPPAQAAPTSPEVKPQDVDISDLAEDYWRPNRDELDVIQNRRFEKAGRVELGVAYGIYQGGDYVNSKSVGATLTYHWNNNWATELSTLKVTNTESEFLQSVKGRYGFTPDFNQVKREHTATMIWSPIYGKFSLLGEKISHFETYFGLGAGITETADAHFTKVAQIGEKFFISNNFVFRIEWKITQYTDQVKATQGTPSVANGGPGFFNQSVTRHNILFGLGWIF